MRAQKFISLFLVLTAVAVTRAQDVPTKANLCFGCHGVQGTSPNPIWPNLARQNAEYIQKQLKDFRGQRRSDPMMNPIAAQLTDAEITQLAEYFSKMK